MNRDLLKCGECGAAAFELHYQSVEDAARFGGGGRHVGKIITHCLKCFSESTIEPSPGALETEGTLCGGWSK